MKDNDDSDDEDILSKEEGEEVKTKRKKDLIYDLILKKKVVFVSLYAENGPSFSQPWVVTPKMIE